jgi:hypothetical protein
MQSIDDNDYNQIDMFWEYESQKESEDDLAQLGTDLIRQAVVSATDWTTETMISQIQKGNIQLSPDFQRRDAWRPARKSRFIESLILGLPVPQIVLATTQSRRGSYLVLDGKQRLLSICQFAANSNDPLFGQLRLSRLEIRRDLNGKTLEDMKSDLSMYDDVSAFENQSIRTIVIKNWPNETFLYHVFHRLNTNSVTLSPQELRQALHPGHFVQFVDQESRTNLALRDILGQAEPDFRMRDTELLIRYLAFKNFMVSYRGNLKAFLDQTCNILNRDWQEREHEIREQLDEFNRIHEAIRSVFGEDSYHKWTGRIFEPRFNRAIFDIMIFAFDDREARQHLINAGPEAISLFKDICINNPDFLSSIEQTTKSMQAVSTRFGVWADILNRNVGTNLPLLSIIDDRLCY